MIFGNIATLEAGIVGRSLIASTRVDTTPGVQNAFAVDPVLFRRPGPLTVTWEVLFPGVIPATVQVDLQGCIDDPTVEANWYQMDTTQSVAGNQMRVVANQKPKFVRTNLIAINAAPGGGVSSNLTLG